MYHTHRTSNVLLSSCATFNSNGDGLRASSPVTKAPSTRLCGDRGTWTRVAEGLWSSGTVLHAPCGSPAAAKPGVALNLGSTPDHPSYPESQQGVHTAGIGSATARSIHPFRAALAPPANSMSASRQIDDRPRHQPTSCFYVSFTPGPRDFALAFILPPFQREERGEGEPSDTAG